MRLRITTIGSLAAFVGLCAGGGAPSPVYAQALTSIPEIQVQSNVAVPMRDGVHLAADIYLPNQPTPIISDTAPP